MVIDCLAAANRTLKFSEDIYDVEQYLMLDDSILSVRSPGHACLVRLLHSLPTTTMLHE